MTTSSLVLVHGLFAAGEAGALADAAAQRAQAFAEHGPELGVLNYEWVSGRGKAIINALLRRARGTARAVDAVEIIELDATILRASLADQSAQGRWRQIASCEPCGLDTARSFILLGSPRQLLDGAAAGQRVLWFGRGLSQLSETEFIAHYTGRHGPLVAGHAQPIGLQWYRQVPAEQDAMGDSLRQLGLGQANPPVVFAELVMGRPPFDLASLRARRIASAEIKADEKRHIDFSRSMLLLV